MSEEILKIRDFNKGTMLKQGDSTTLKYYLYDADEEQIESIIGKTAEVVFIKGGQVYYRTSGVISDLFICEFKIEEVLPTGVYHIEFLVDGHIFPSGDKPYFTLTASSKGINDQVIRAHGFEEVVILALEEVESRSAERLADLESDYATRLTGLETNDQNLTAQLAEIVTEVSEKTDPYNGYRFAGHRGCNLAPENTKASIELSKKIGFNILETDIKLTSDKEWVVFHDDTVDRITNGTGNIETLTLSQVKALTITKGTNNTDVYTTEKILTLDEMLDLINKLDMYLVLEIKSIATTPDYQKVLDALKRKNVLKKTMIHSFNVDIIESFYHLDPNLKLGWIQNGDITQGVIHATKSWLGKNCSLASNVYNLTETGASLAINNGVPIYAWNILNYDDIDKAFKLGCSYVVAGDISEEMYNEYNLL